MKDGAVFQPGSKCTLEILNLYMFRPDIIKESGHEEAGDDGMGVEGKADEEDENMEDAETLGDPEVAEGSSGGISSIIGGVAGAPGSVGSSDFAGSNCGTSSLGSAGEVGSAISVGVGSVEGAGSSVAGSWSPDAAGSAPYAPRGSTTSVGRSTGRH